MKLFGNSHNVGEEGQSLPDTRRKAFLFYSKEHFGKLVLVSAMNALFFLPSLIWLYVMNYSKEKFVASLDVNAADYAQKLLSYGKSYVLTTYGVLVAFLALFFIGLAGSFYITKRISLCESVKIRDYFKGIKQDGLKYFLFGALFGVTVFLLRFNSISYSSQKGLLSGILFWGAVMLCAIVLIVLFYCMTQCALYEVKAGQMIKNALLLTFSKFFYNIVVLIAVAAPVVAVLFIPSPFQILGLMLLALFYSGFAVMFVTNYCLWIYDLTINPKLGEEYVGKGLCKKK